MAAVALAHVEEQRGEPVDVAAQHLAHDQVLLLARDGREVGGLAGEVGVEAGERLLAVGIDEQSVHPVQEVVAGRARHRPRLAQPLARLQDLLGHDPRRRRRVVEPAEVVLGIAQAVRMVDPQAVEHAVAEPLQNEGVGVGEDAILLGAQAHQRVDVEEAAIAEVAAGRPPERQPVVLPLEQGVQRVGAGVDLVDHAGDRGRDVGLLAQEPVEELAQHFLVAMALLHAEPVRGRRERQAAERVGDEGQRVRARAHGRGAERLVERRRRQRKRVLVIGHREHRALAVQAERPRLQRAPVVLAQHRQQHGVAQAALRRIPVDVEVRRVAAGRPVLQHVPPPGVAAGGDGHVVGHHVEDLSEPVPGQREAEPRVALGPAQLLVHAAVIDHVVAVDAAGHRLQIRRAIEVADPEIGEVAGDVDGVVEREPAVELDAVGRARRIRPRGPVAFGIERHAGWGGKKGARRSRKPGEPSG